MTITPVDFTKLWAPGECEALARREGGTFASWEQFSRWCKEHARLNPDDERSDAELVDEYCRQNRAANP